jgi:glycosyltransferase involved in cell wall biosynthesis
MRPILIEPVKDTRSRSGLRRVVRRAGVGLRLSAAWAQILLAVRSRRYDAVVLTSEISLPPAALGARLLGGLPGMPSVGFIMHNVRMFNRSASTNLVVDRSLSTRMLDAALRRFDVVFVHGDESRREIETIRPGLPLAVIPHGDERIFATDPPPPAVEERVLFFGNWVRVKGIEVLIAAFDLLLRERPDAKLTIAGQPYPDEVDVAAIQSWAAGHGDRVEIVGRYIPFDEVTDLFARARVVTTPYLLGYQSGVVHLAMTMARPVVTSDVGDLGAAVVDGHTGLVVPPGDPQALASALAEVLADPVLAATLGAAGHQRLERESGWKTVAGRIEEELEAVV